MRMRTGESYRDTEGVEPYAFYERVRATGDVVWDPGMMGWLVVSFELARRVCRDDTLFVHPLLGTQVADTDLRASGHNPRSFLFAQADQRRAMHHWWVTDMLSPQWIERCKPMIDVALANLTSRISHRSEFDLVSEYIDHVPICIFAQLLDLPRKDDDFLKLIKSLNDRIATFMDATTADMSGPEALAEYNLIEQRAVDAADQLDQILKLIILERKGGKGQDFISRLWAGGPAIFSDWNELDTLDGCRPMIYATFDSVSYSAANAFHMLLTDADLMRNVRQGGPKVIEKFCEEALRLNSSVQFRPRRATADTKLGNAKIKKGDRVFVVLLAANRDPQTFTCPHEVDLDRWTPRKHLSFFSGSRTCPGSALARAEIVGALEHALARFPSLKLDHRAPPPKFNGSFIRSHRPLHVKVDGAPSGPFV